MTYLCYFYHLLKMHYQTTFLFYFLIQFFRLLFCLLNVVIIFNLMPIFLILITCTTRINWSVLLAPNKRMNSCIDIIFYSSFNILLCGFFYFIANFVHLTHLSPQNIPFQVMGSKSNVIFNIFQCFLLQIIKFSIDYIYRNFLFF